MTPPNGEPNGEPSAPAGSPREQQSADPSLQRQGSVVPQGVHQPAEDRLAEGGLAEEPVPPAELNAWRRGFTPQAEIWNGRLAMLGLSVGLTVLLVARLASR